MTFPNWYERQYAMATRPNQMVAYSARELQSLASLICAEKELEYPSASSFCARQRRIAVIGALKSGRIGNTRWAKSMHAANVAKHRWKRAEMQAKSIPTAQGPRAEKYAKMAAKKKAQHAKTT